MYGQDILCGISKGTFEIPHKISHPYIERCGFYSPAKIQELLDLRAEKCFWNAPLNWYCELSNNQLSLILHTWGLNKMDIILQATLSNAFLWNESSQLTFVQEKPINPLKKSHNAPVPYPTMHHFVTEMCIHAHFCYKVVHCGIFVWCIVGSVRWVYWQ